MISYEIIIEKIRNKEYEPKTRYPKLTRYKADAVIDENKSVKWNKEEIEKRNNERTKALKEYNNSIDVGEVEFKEDIASYLTSSNEGVISNEQAKVISNEAWIIAEGLCADDLVVILDLADELAELIITVRNLI